MKTDRAEGSAVSAQVISTALVAPGGLHPVSAGRKRGVPHAGRRGRVESCVYSLFGREFAAGLLKASSGERGVAVTGFVGTPVSARR